MKMNEQKQEQTIRAIYKNTQTPDAVKIQIDETLNFLKQQESVRSAVQTKEKRRRPLSFKKAAVLAAAAILGISGTVFAAERIYTMHLKKNREYQASLQISSDESLPEEVAEVEINVNYIPEGFVLTPEKWEYQYTNPARGDAGYYIEGPMLADQADPLTVSFVKDSEALTISGHDAVYICKAYSRTADTDWKNETLFILYEDVNRILSVNAWGYTDKNELLKMAESITLTPTGNMTAASEIPRWSEMISSEKESEKEETESEEDDYYFEEATEEQMANVHQIGDKFKIRSSLDDAYMTVVDLEASVTDIQTADDLSLLTKEEEIPAYLKELVGPDGKLLPDTLHYIKLGDGVNTLDEIIRTEEAEVKLVYATVEFTNPGTETLHDASYFVSLMPVVKEDNTYKIFTRTDDSCDYVENTHLGVKHEMSYADVSGGHNHNNYIPEIKPGESVTVHFAWAVHADELDKLYLNFNGDGAYLFTEEGLKTGYVKAGNLLK